MDGRKHGEGTLTWPDGRSYCGQWQDGKQHGTAVAQTAKGLKRQSIWKDGDLGAKSFAPVFPGMCFFLVCVFLFEISCFFGGGCFLQLEFRFLIRGVGWEVGFFDDGFYINTFDPNDVPTPKLSKTNVPSTI